MVNCTFVSTNRKGYAITMPGYGSNSMLVRNCAFFGFNTITNNVSIIKQADSTNNATNLPSFGWTAANNLVNLSTSSQFNNVASGAEDFRIREYSSLINNAVRDQQYTGDADIIGRARSTAASTIGAWSWEASPSSNRLVTGIQSKNPQTGAVVDMGSYYVSKDYGLDVYPNLVPGRTSPGLYSWGLNSDGGLGSGTTTTTSSPVQVGSLTNWRQVSAWRQTMAIKTDGTLWACGYNGNGELGLGNTVNYSSPIQVGTDNKWKIVVASDGGAATAAIKTDGTLWTWGYNGAGELGLGNIVNYSSPMQVGSDNKWKSVSMGTQSVAAIKTDGTLWTWGNNDRGGLGLGDTTNRSSPTEVGGNYWATVSMGNRRMTAIKTDGTLWTCGYNSNDGELGIGISSPSYSSPVQIGTLNDWKMVSSAEYSTLCIKTNGTLWAWGYNGVGQLGNNQRISYRSPIQIGSLSNWKSVSFAGFSPTVAMAIKTDGTLWAWGSNFYGGLGLSNLVNYSSPVQVGSLTTWKSVSPGYYYTIAISDGQV
jgi:alpha-tubulin suppressor-like RCC1 family protein